MRVLLVGPDHESNLSLLYLAASLRAAGHAPDIAAFNSWADAPAVLARARTADLVGLSMCFQVRAAEFLALADALEAAAPERPIVAGGHHASCAAAELLERHPALDAIVLHEGEETLVELASLGADLAARAGDVRGVAVRRDGRAVLSPPRPILADLDRLPRPDRSGPARLLCGVPTAYLMGSRGCVGACDYCCITTLHRLAPGPRFRQRTPEDVADEMGDLYHRHGVRQFVFHDDNFLVPSAAHNRDRIARLDTALRANGVREIGLVLKCAPRDAERGILETLRGMGLLRLFMGVESASARGLASIGRRQAVAQSEAALALCEELGISSQYTLITFHPEATPATMLADLDFVARHPAHPLNYCRAEIYAGTPLEARMRSEGRAEGSYLGRTYRYTDPAVARVWEVGSDLFAGRCWGKDDLLGLVIRIDHQVAVLRRFYEGSSVEALARSFLGWQVELHLETAAFFRELVLACADATSATDPALLRAVADLRRREAPSREARLRQLCDYRRTLERYAHASVAIARRQAVGGRARQRFVRPRHAAAVAVAIGMLGGAPALAAEGAPPPPAPFRDDVGVAEAAPPPLDERRRRSKLAPDEEALVPPPPRHDVGVAEAAPPPFRNDFGVAEAAPPPLDRPIAPAMPSVLVRTEPVVPLAIASQPVGHPYRLLFGAGTPLRVGNGKRPWPATARVRALRGDGREVTLRIEADRPLEVRYRGKVSRAPIELAVPLDGRAPPVVLVDRRTRARVKLLLGPP